MKRRGLILATVASLFLTGLVLDWSGLLIRHPQTAQRSGEARAQALDPMATDASLRYRHCQPTHWRAIMLQH